MAKPKVFLDSSVIITALLSSQGGSFYILNSLTDDFEFQTNEFGLREIQKILKNKFAGSPGLLVKLFLLLGTANIVVLLSPSKRDLNSFTKHISFNDAPILASAAKHSDFLLTLDKEFLQEKVVSLGKRKSLIIMAPKEFIQFFRK